MLPSADYQSNERSKLLCQPGMEPTRRFFLLLYIFQLIKFPILEDLNIILRLFLSVISGRD
jgi:hypothetical protein